MLEELSIRNYALIDSITLSFRPGFNVLTGETGAGKSIIVGSLSFLMGGKAEIDVIRSGCDEASVSAVISIDKNTQALQWLKARDIECEETQDFAAADSDYTVIVRRNIKTSGRSSVFIQNVPVTRQDLAEFTGMLFDIHGQHNHESLLRKDSHRRFLDSFAGLENEARSFCAYFIELTEKRKNLESSLKSDREREERLELLNFAVDEITKAKIHAGEIRELENEAQKLSDFEKLIGLINTAAVSFIDGESSTNQHSVLSLARKTKNALDSASAVDSSLGEITRRFENLFYEAQDIAGDFRSYRDNLSFDPGRLEEVNERLSLLYKLKKKYVKNTGAQGNDEDAILLYMSNAQTEIEALSGAEENREKLKKDIGTLEKTIVAKAKTLRERRTEASEKLSQSITGILKHLGMPNACFKAAIIPRQNDGQISYGPYGSEDTEFLISANTGEPLKDLSKIASGGELSRVMLAIKTALLSKNISGGQSKNNGNLFSAQEQNENDVQTLIFDEIDAGIGGEVALKVGEYLTEIGKLKQIFCVTHLASIAVRADNHFKVEKRTEGGRTYTGIGPLSAQGRRTEIARMLAGDSGSAALAHADDLIKKYSKRSG
ncbi:MAG: DNA repair protein RecN [Treponema sp.]|jgi:DNA repair protein RecN (Recombination protein N)|nr:DNA repair protein RecN [Treponema sp.]